MTRLLFAGVAICLLSGFVSAQSQPAATQPGTAAQIGEKIDRGLSQLGKEISQAWGEVRQGVEKMGVQGRVYGRLHWDKALEGAALDIDVRDKQVVVLRGKVASAAAKQKAEQLAGDTIGVSSVVNELAIAGTASP
jgi:osmotically-inducible protein OsmY